MTLALDIRLELLHRRHDLEAIKHDYTRYGEIVNQAIREVPRALWRLDADTRIATEVNVRRYSLAAVPGLTEAAQVVGVFMDDTLSNALEIGRWEIEDDLGALTLVLDEDPAAGLDLTLYYLRPWDVLDFSNPSSETSLDQEWLIAKAMTFLLLEADPTGEDSAYLAAQLQVWDARRQARELVIRRRRRSRLMRSPASLRAQRKGTAYGGDDYLILE